MTLTHIIVGVIGYYLGKNSVKTETFYEPTKTIHDTIVNIKVDTAYLPSKVKYITKRDTVSVENVVHVIESVDTAAILKDWSLVREYKNKELFNNDTIGSMSIDAKVQYNQLQQVSYNYTPIRKVVKIDKHQGLQPFIGAGINSQIKPVINTGVFYNKYGVSYQYQTIDNWKPVHSLSVIYRF